MVPVGAMGSFWPEINTFKGRGGWAVSKVESLVRAPCHLEFILVGRT